MGILAKNDNMFFDTLEKAYGDPELGIGGSLEAQKQIKIALQAFIEEPKNILKKVQKGIQAEAVSTDFAQLTKDAFNVTIDADNFDLGYEQAFKGVTLGKGQDSWEIYDVSNSLTFVKVEEGQRIEVAGLTGTKTTAYVDYYGGALGWTDKLIRFRKVPAMIDKAQVFRNKFWSNKADNFYALLGAAGALNVIAAQGAAADGRLQRNIQTINYGAWDIGNTCKDKGYGDMANAPMVIYANPYDEDRIEAAFRATTSALAGSTATGAGVDSSQITRRRIKRVYTYNSNISVGSPLLVLPGQKIQAANAMAPTTYTAPQDILTLNYVQSVWAIYGGIVADTDQVVQLTLV